MALAKTFFLVICLLGFGCTKPEEKPEASEVEIAFRSAFEAKDIDALRAYLFLPPNMLDEQRMRILNHRIALNSSAKRPVELGEVTIKGRWASAVFLTDPSTPLGNTYIAFRTSNDQWQLFWDPQGALLWGKQGWHSDLSEGDWEDYRSLKN